MKNGLTFLKGAALVIGGAALGFFGCLGGIQANSQGIVFGSLIIGGLAVVGGLAVMLIGFVKGLSGLAKPKE